jgi:hypothetical protein
MRDLDKNLGRPRATNERERSALQEHGALPFKQRTALRYSRRQPQDNGVLNSKTIAMIEKKTFFVATRIRHSLLDDEKTHTCRR